MQITKNKAKVLALFCTTLALCSFSFAEGLPDWVKSPEKVFPSERYFAQLGSGTTQKKAELDAVENMAAIFSRDIKSTSVASQRMVQAQKDGQVETGSVAGFSREIRQEVSQENLLGIELKGSCFDGKLYYAIAVMDKAKTASALVSMIQKNNAVVTQLLNYGGDDEYSLANYGKLRFAYEIAMMNEKYLEKLNVINVDSAVILRKRCVIAESILEKMEDVAGEIPIYIEVDGDFENQVKQAFSDMITSNGFNASDNSRERYSITAKVTIVKRIPKDGKTIQYMYNLEGYLADTDVGQNLWPFSLTGREASIDEIDVTFRTYRTLGTKVKTTVNESFINFLNSL